MCGGGGYGKLLYLLLYFAVNLKLLKKEKKEKEKEKSLNEGSILSRAKPTWLRGPGWVIAPLEPGVHAFLPSFGQIQVNSLVFPLRGWVGGHLHHAHSTCTFWVHRAGALNSVTTLSEAQATTVWLWLTQAPQRPEGRDFAGISAWDLSPLLSASGGARSGTPTAPIPGFPPQSPSGGHGTGSPISRGFVPCGSASLTTGVGTSSDWSVISLDIVMVQGLF